MALALGLWEPTKTGSNMSRETPKKQKLDWALEFLQDHQRSSLSKLARDPSGPSALSPSRALRGLMSHELGVFTKKLCMYQFERAFNFKVMMCPDFCFLTSSFAAWKLKTYSLIGYVWMNLIMNLALFSVTGMMGIGGNHSPNGFIYLNSFQGCVTGLVRGKNTDHPNGMIWYLRKTM